MSDTNDSHSLCYGRMHENPELLIWGVSLEKKITLLGKKNLFLKTRWLLEVKETFKASGLEALKKSFLLTKKKKKILLEELDYPRLKMLNGEVILEGNLSLV